MLPYVLFIKRLRYIDLFFIFFSGGTNTGVMKHVGEAVRHMNVVGGAASDINVLGIATWGIVDRSADLISEVCLVIQKMSSIQFLTSSLATVC